MTGCAAPFGQIDLGGFSCLEAVYLADILAQTEFKDASFRVAAFAVEHLQAGTHSRMRDADRRFLLFRLKWILVSITEFADSEAFKRARTIEATSVDLDLKRVGRTLLRMFPTPPELAAQLDRYMWDNRDSESPDGHDRTYSVRSAHVRFRPAD